LSHQSNYKTNLPKASGVDSVKIRQATQADVAVAAELIVRTKRLNNEFDPLFTVVSNAKERAESYVANSLKSRDVLLLVAAAGQKVVGILRAEMRDRLYYVPSRSGHITDLYILPEFRRKALGNEMLERAAVELKKMGAEIVTAEVPSQNDIAVRFYTKRGFRSLVQIFAGKGQ
jgi:ribosomal protein S18 acetylase RimI-like enzyme